MKEVVDQVAEDSFVLELAVVDVVPTKVLINATGAAAGFLVPGGGLIRHAGTGSIAIEGIIRDGKSGRAIAAFKDREAAKTAPFSLKDYQRYAFIRQAIEEWVQQYAELAALAEVFGG